MGPWEVFVKELPKKIPERSRKMKPGGIIKIQEVVVN